MSAKVLDAGCGHGEFLIRVIEATGASGVGIDFDPVCVNAACENAQGRLPTLSIDFCEANLQEVQLESDSLDLAICIGATHAFASAEAAYPSTIKVLTSAVRRGGKILIGEGYWKQTPDTEYLKLIGEPVGIYRDHSGNISFAEETGLKLLYTTVSDEDEWDHFEGSHKRNIELRALNHPNDYALAEKLGRSREWSKGYLRWGRSTMGFGYYLFEKQ